MADGAHDGDSIYRPVAGRAPAATVIIPPCATTMVSEAAVAGTPTPRDRHIQMIAAKDRLGWPKPVGFSQRSFLVTGMLCCRTIVSRTLPARILPARKVEARIGLQMLNRMTALSIPAS